MRCSSSAGLRQPCLIEALAKRRGPAQEGPEGRPPPPRPPGPSPTLPERLLIPLSFPSLLSERCRCCGLRFKRRVAFANNVGVLKVELAVGAGSFAGKPRALISAWANC